MLYTAEWFYLSNHSRVDRPVCRTSTAWIPVPPFVVMAKAGERTALEGSRRSLMGNAKRQPESTGSFSRQVPALERESAWKHSFLSLFSEKDLKTGHHDYAHKQNPTTNFQPAI